MHPGRPIAWPRYVAIGFVLCSLLLGRGGHAQALDSSVDLNAVPPASGSAATTSATARSAKRTVRRRAMTTILHDRGSQARRQLAGQKAPAGAQRTASHAHLGGNAQWDAEFGPIALPTRVAKFVRNEQQHPQQRISVTGERRASWSAGWGLHTDGPTRSTGVDIMPSINVVPKAKSPVLMRPAARSATAMRAVHPALRDTGGLAGRGSRTLRGARGRRRGARQGPRAGGDRNWMASILSREMEDDPRRITQTEVRSARRAVNPRRPGTRAAGRRRALTHPVMSAAQRAGVFSSARTAALDRTGLNPVHARLDRALRPAASAGGVRPAMHAVGVVEGGDNARRGGRTRAPATATALHVRDDAAWNREFGPALVGHPSTPATPDSEYERMTEEVAAAQRAEEEVAEPWRRASHAEQLVGSTASDSADGRGREAGSGVGGGGEADATTGETTAKKEDGTLEGEVGGTLARAAAWANELNPVGAADGPPRKAPIAKVTRDLESRLGLGGSGQQKEDQDGDDWNDKDEWGEDGDYGYGATGDDEPQEEVRDFERDVQDAFDLEKITFATIPLHQWAWWVASIFVALTIVVSGQLIWSHLDSYDKPEVQKYVVRIIFMTPIYGVVAWLSLTFDNAAPLLNVVRDCYEAFTLYNFVKMLYVWCGGERKVMDMMAQKPQMKLPFPLHWFEPWAMGDELFYNCKFGVLQYVLVIPVCAVVAFVTIAAGAYEGPEWYTMDLWITMVAISSATWAIYCLVTFYLAMQEEIEASVSNALGKFLCVKAVVFLCFYQGLALNLVLIIGYIPSSDTVSEKRFIRAVENWLICLEMFVIAICFSLVFPVEEITAPQNAEGASFSSGARAETGRSTTKDTAPQSETGVLGRDAAAVGGRAPSPQYGSLDQSRSPRP